MSQESTQKLKFGDGSLDAENPLASTTKYSARLRTLHWLMASGFVLLFVSGPIMVDLDKQDPLRATLFSLHKSFGVLAILLLAGRIDTRLRSTLPEFPAALQDWQKRLAHWGHRILYLLMIATPLTGWATSDFHGKPVALFGLPLPKLFPTVEGVGSWPGDVHTVIAYSLLAVVIVHIAAVAKHRLLDRVDLLGRIL